MLPPSHSLAVRSVEAGRRLHAPSAAARRRRGRRARGSSSCSQADPAPADAYLPRPISAAWADDEELAFLLDIRGAGHAALAGGRHGRACSARSGTASSSRPGPALLVGGGIGAAILPWLVRAPARTPASLLGFRTEAHAVCAGLVDPDATVVVEPELVTEPLARLLPASRARSTPAARTPMLGAVAALAAEHGVACQLAMEAAMACGFGACHGCAVKIDGAGSGCASRGRWSEASRAVA